MSLILFFNSNYYFYVDMLPNIVDDVALPDDSRNLILHYVSEILEYEYLYKLLNFLM